MAFCSNCGRSRLDDAAFCTECGAKIMPSPPEAAGRAAGAAPQTPGAPPVDPAEPRPGRRRLPLWLTASIMVVGATLLAGGFFLLGRQGDGDDPRRPGDNGRSTVAAPAPTAAPAASAPTTAPPSAPSTDPCAEAGARLQAILASAGAEPPGPTETAEADEALAQWIFLACDVDVASAPSSPIGLALASAIETGLTVRSVIDSAAAAAGALTPTGEATPGPILPAWISIVASLETADTPEAEAAGRAASVAEALGEPVYYLNSTDYYSLNPGYWAVHMGPFAARSEAMDTCVASKNAGIACYDRYLAQLPLTTGPFEACGEFGTLIAVGADDARTGPGAGNRLTAALKPGAYYLAAGTAQSSEDGATWHPLAIGGTIAWVDSASLQWASGCDEPAPTSCQGLAAMVEDGRERMLDSVADPSGSVDAEEATALKYAVDKRASLGCDDRVAPVAADPATHTPFQRLVAALAGN